MKHTAKLLLAAMVLALTSCGSEAASVDSTETMNGSETVVESETTAENPFDTLESIDFGGRDFTFVGRLSYEDELCIDEATGDVKMNL